MAQPLALLSDHAHCEIGAASTAQSLIARHPRRAALVNAMGALAQEELSHFRRVIDLLHRMGGQLDVPRKNPYLTGLLRHVRREREPALLDRLLVGALVERRSLERFELLVDVVDGDLQRMFVELGPSERGHALRFVELAEMFFGVDATRRRLEQLLDSEAEVARSIPFDYRVHGGPVVVDSPVVKA